MLMDGAVSAVVYDSRSPEHGAVASLTLTLALTTLSEAAGAKATTPTPYLLNNDHLLRYITI